MPKRNLVSIFDLNKEEIYEIFKMAEKVKNAQKKGLEEKRLKDKTLAMIFEKPSLRTRVTFETGMTQLGGHAIYLAPADIKLGKRESVPDVGRELAENSAIPVINGLSDLEHPCQIMCDLFTVIEKKGGLEHITIAYIGDGNNVCNSFVAASALLGFRFIAATPQGYEPNREYLEKAKTTVLTTDPEEAVKDADIVYTDVWASMGQEDEAEQRKKLFKPYQLNSELLKAARKEYLVMHCLPAHRGEEITDEVIDGPHSIVFDQAENRLHIQKAIMLWLLQH